MTNNLIDQAPIEAAQQAFGDAERRLAWARVNLDAASAAHAVAKADAEGAEAGTIELDPHVADEALAATERRLAVATRVLQKAEAGLIEANSNRRVANGVAWRPVYIQGAKSRIEAMKQIDAAKAKIAQAQAEYAAATQVINEAIANGCDDVIYTGHTQRVMADASAEIKMWTVDCQPGGWWKPSLVTG